MKGNHISLLVALVMSVLMAVGCSEKGQPEALTTKPQKGEFVVSVVSTGELQAKNSVDILGPNGARKAGLFQMKITDLVPEGTVVKPGDYVADLDKNEIVTKLKEVEINLQKFGSQYTGVRLDCTLTLSQARDELVNLRYALEQRQLEKEESKFEAPSARRQAEIEAEKASRAFEQAKINYQTKVKQAEAKMKEAEADLNKEQQKQADLLATMAEFTILAPESGMVIYKRDWDGRKRVVGSSINVWDPTVATLPDLTQMESITQVNEVDIQKIQVGQKVKISLDASTDKKLTGEVTSVANIGEQRPNSDSKVFEVKIKVIEKDSTLRPAMTTSNEIIIETIPDAMFIPLESVHSEADSITYVFVKKGGSVEKQQVTLGSENENYVVVLKGLSMDDEILLTKPENHEELKMNSL